MTYTDTTPDDDCPTCGWGQSYCTCDPQPRSMTYMEAEALILCLTRLAWARAA